MKRKFACMPLALLAAGFMSMAGCGGNSGASDAVEPFRTDSVSYTDSVKIGDCFAVCRLTADYPVGGDSALVKNVRDWVAASMAYPGVEGAKVFDDVADGNAFLDSVGNYMLGMAKYDFADFAKEGFNITYSYDLSAKKAYQTDTYVTYLSSGYVYLGGAHGMSYDSGAVFALSDGEEYGWNMFEADSLPAIKELIKAKVAADYFKAKDMDEFRRGLLVDPDTLPLPANSPYFLSDGVHFMYQLYEIAPYAAGMPECVLPFAEMEPMFTPAVRALVSGAGRD